MGCFRNNVASRVSQSRVTTINQWEYSYSLAHGLLRTNCASRPDELNINKEALAVKIISEFGTWQVVSKFAIVGEEEISEV